MQNYSTSKQLIKNTKNFIKVKHYSWTDCIFSKKGLFYGWGRKRSGLRAIELAKKMGTSFILLEDGFIRSLGLGVDGSPSFSLVEDDIGIYYDATAPSRLEMILSSYDFTSDEKLMGDARRAMELIVEHNISKYNDTPEDISVIPNLIGNLDPRVMPENEKKVLIIAQTAGDASLEYGMLQPYTTDDIINAAITENPDATIWLKIHPDVLSGKKKSDIEVEHIPSNVKIITQNLNPIALLKHFDKVYTKTSGMGFEALIVGCECVCFGMPFYAGWGMTDDRSVILHHNCHSDLRVKPEDDVFLRRRRKLSVKEIFAAAYILYTRYYNPYTNKTSDIFDTIETIVQMRSVV